MLGFVPPLGATAHHRLMDHPHADHLGLVNAVDVQTFLDNVRLWTHDHTSVSYHNPGLRPLTVDFVFWRRSQALDHIYVLIVVFTLLVVIAATQGNVVHRSTEALQAAQSDIP